jgi:hypothetical protein
VPQITPPPLELHAPLVFDPAAEPKVEVRRLNGALRVLYTQLVGCVHAVKSGTLQPACLSTKLRLHHTRRALADGSTEYDGVVHNIRVVLSNLHFLVSSLREPQALDALAHAFKQQAAQLQETGNVLRTRTEEAVRVEAAAREALHSLALLP